ncbi:hypothetical protein SLS56_009153 [Neofusicoccum ribis]|uniref:Carrier domain-containing protein n=1 Tax=Neofusicoccum ribis TaxID=45134 RepID=A0ABR3SI42_9PEZI
MSATTTVTNTATTLATCYTIDELIKGQAERPDNPVLVAYPVTDIDDFEEHTAKDLDRYTDAAVEKYRSLGLARANPEGNSAPVVALLAPSSFEVIVTILAASRLGWALLFLSTRLTAPAHARLLQMAGCNAIIAAPQQQDMVSQISHELTQSSASPLKAVPLITRADCRASATSVPIGRVSAHTGALQGSKTAWIIHSSGSTGFPKPIFLSHRALLANFAKGLGLRAFCASPLFHSHGLMELFRCIYRGAPMYMANHARPVTRANLVRAMRAAAPELVTAVPFVLGLLAEGPDGVAELVRAEVVMFAGSACPDAVGDRLVEAGVNLVANYGSSETGAIMSSLRPRGDTAWAYVRMAAPVAPHVLMDEIAPGVFECVALESLASRGPSNCDDPPNSFRTRDLFTRHPDPARRHWWKYLTRLDDRLTLVNGEKVLPLPIEGRVRQSERVAEAVVFGAGRAVPGLLVFRALGERAMGDGEFVEAVWEAVEDANRGAESFSRIPRELVVPMPLGTEWPRTDKGTVVRQQVYDVFKDVIDGAYARFEQIDQDADSDEPLLSLDVPELEQWLLERLRVDLGAQLQSAEADIFAAGVDSLQTMRMWSHIRKTLDLGTRREELSQNVVYEKGNVKVLAKHLYGLRTGEEVEQSDEDELLAMQELVEKYSIFDEHVPEDVSKPEGEVVLCLQVKAPRPAALYFASSVSATGGLATLLQASGGAGSANDMVVVPEDVPQPLAAAQKMGYGRSKLVCEKIVQAAAERTRMRACVLRIGQLVGDLWGVGDWNATEAIPLLVRGAWSTGVLPALDETPSWLPIDVAAAAILDIALPEEGLRVDDETDETVRVYHILNPNTFHWTHDFIPALRRTGLLPPFGLASPSEWLAKLRDSDHDVEKNPSRKLLGFWEGKYGGSNQGKRGLSFDTTRTIEKAPRLGNVLMADVLRNEGWVERVVRRWVELQ